jgi:hypothetical protein
LGGPRRRRDTGCLGIPMTVALVTHGSGTLDTTGANLIVIFISDFQSSWSVSDSKSNTYTKLTATSAPWRCCLAYCLNPTVGSGHTFTVTGGYNQRYVAAFSGVGAGGFDKDSRVTAPGSQSTLQQSSLTPAADDSLIVAGWGGGYGVPTVNLNSVDSGFTVLGKVSNYYAAALAYKVQTAAGAESPTGSMSAANANFAAAMAVFAGSAGGGAVAAPRSLYGRQAVNRASTY